MRVLVVGGARFIDSHTVDALIERGYAARVIDNLDPQVHPNGAVPDYLDRKAEFSQEGLDCFLKMTPGCRRSGQPEIR